MGSAVGTARFGAIPHLASYPHPVTHTAELQHPYQYAKPVSVSNGFCKHLAPSHHPTPTSARHPSEPAHPHTLHPAHATVQVPGFLLLRDANNGTIFFLPPADEYDGLQQLDLSDDVVVAELFSNTAWQDVMAPVSVRAGDSSDLQPLKLSERDFRQAVSLLADAEEPEDEEEEEEVQGQR